MSSEVSELKLLRPVFDSPALTEQLVADVNSIAQESFSAEDASEIERLVKAALYEHAKIQLAYVSDDSDKTVAFLLFSEKPTFIYIAWFAVAKSMRSKGLGARMLEELYTMRGRKSLVVDIEPVVEDDPNSETRARRRRFYEREGFTPLAYTLKSEDERYEIMCKGYPVTWGKFATVIPDFGWHDITLIPK